MQIHVFFPDSFKLYLFHYSWEWIIQYCQIRIEKQALGAYIISSPEIISDTIPMKSNMTLIESNRCSRY